MIRWEYKLLHAKLSRESKIEEAFNEMGAQGWEFIMETRSAYFFKRPIGGSNEPLVPPYHG